LGQGPALRALYARRLMDFGNLTLQEVGVGTFE